MIDISETKNYHNFGVFLARRKISNSHKLAFLLIQKFALSKKTKEYQSITFEELKDKGILPCNEHKTYTHWREDLIKKGILICMASKEELKSTCANYKGNMFKTGDIIKKYIDNAIFENLPNKVDSIDIKVDQIENNVDQLKLELEKTQIELKETNYKIDKVIEYLLKENPPDTPERQKTLKDNIDNLPMALEILNKEKSFDTITNNEEIVIN